MVKIEYEIIKKEFFENSGILYIEFYYWINGERSKTNISIGSDNIEKWEKELDYYIKKLSNKFDFKKSFDKVSKDIKIGKKKEYKKVV